MASRIKMKLVTKHILPLCDGCKKGMKHKPAIVTDDVPNEGCSDIRASNGSSFSVGNQQYCSLRCLFNHIRRALQ